MMKYTLAQCNPRVGDISGNTEKILQEYEQACHDQSDLIIFPELMLPGYPPEDLVFRSGFRTHLLEALEAIAAKTKGKKTAILLGTITEHDNSIYNAACLIEDGTVIHEVQKHHLPNYGVFDEKRVFSPGPSGGSPISFREMNLGILICEDAWHDTYVTQLTSKDVDLCIVLNASPFEAGKQSTRQEIITRYTQETDCPFIYVNMVGGQDGIVFDGGSFITQPHESLTLPYWQEASVITQWQNADDEWQCDAFTSPLPLSKEEHLYQAMVLGLRDYVGKNHFPGVVLGLSGGIDSALAATIAVDALGKENVHAVMLPSMYTSQESLDDAKDCANRLGISYQNLAITPIYEAAIGQLTPAFEGKDPDLTEENVQSRIRGLLLMALSNKHGWMVMTTGNKSEMATGYATLYGDMCGGFNPLKDLYKTQLFEISKWRNQHCPEGCLGSASVVIPDAIITKPPTAELRPNQQDQDSLPPYETLDAILMQLIEEQQSVSEVIASGFERKTVEKIARLLYGAEHKRRQSAPGVKLTSMCFGYDRRYPITNRYTAIELHALTK